jgi:shikimate kinase
LVYLKVTPATAALRMGGEVLTRPLLASGSPVEGLQRLLDQRGALYESADYVIDTEVVDLQGVINQVAALTRRVGGATG